MSLSKPRKKTRRKTDFAENPQFMDWCGANLPASHNYFITDIDTTILAFRDRKGCLMLVEIKLKQFPCKTHQHTTFSIIHQAVRAGFVARQGRFKVGNLELHVEYGGFHLLTFENTSPYDGRIFWNHEEITEQELIEKLSMQQRCCC